MTRVLSALVILAVVGLTVWWAPARATAVLAAVVAGLAAIELGDLVRPLGAPVPRQFVVLSAAVLCLTASDTFSMTPFEPDPIVAFLIMITLGAGVMALVSITPGPGLYYAIAAMTLAPVYIGLPLGTLAWLRQAHGAPAVFWLLGVIMLSDSAQYYAGTLWGRRKLAPTISPGKTVEGLIGGLIVAPLAGWAIGLWAWPGRAPIETAAVGLALAVFGIMGDLFESLLKRSAGAKDSSTLIPGHGGVLDRIDSYLFAAPAFYLYLRYLA